MKKITLLLLSVFISCQNNKNETTEKQPDILKRNSMLDFSKVTFNEDAIKLVSTIIESDTIFNPKNIESFKEETEFPEGYNHESIIILPEKRYFFETKHIDSIAFLGPIAFNNVSIETDANKKIKAFLCYGQVFENEDIEGKINTIFNILGNSIEETNMIENNVPFKAKEYRYFDKYNPNFFWDMGTYYIQLDISKGGEINITTDEGFSQKMYYLLEFLFITKDEYNLVKDLQKKTTEEKKMLTKVLKPYSIKSLTDENFIYQQEMMDLIGYFD